MTVARCLRAVLRRARRWDYKACVYNSSTAAVQCLARAQTDTRGVVTHACRMQIQKILSGVAARNASGEFFYTRFFAIGLFRMLELTEAHDPKALKGLVTVRSRSRSLARSV